VKIAGGLTPPYPITSFIHRHIESEFSFFDHRTFGTRTRDEPTREPHVIFALGSFHTVLFGDIEAVKIVDQSTMPTGLLDDLDEQQIADLFAFLRSGK
jgi:hypothetical protein